MVRLVCWNIAKCSEPWRELVEMARQGEADVVLLQEAGNPPGELAHLVRHTTTQRRLRSSGKSSPSPRNRVDWRSLCMAGRPYAIAAARIATTSWYRTRAVPNKTEPGDHGPAHPCRRH